jgi:hypothetical protein
MKAPPERPIVSACGSIIENASHFVEHHIKVHGTQHPSYLQDTPDLLRYLEQINNEGRLPKKTLAVTWDVIGLYTNIPHKEGMDAVREAHLKASQNGETQDMSTEFIIRILEVILENNIFEFNSELYRQNVGAAMGCKPIPPYANIFMSKIDKKILEIANANKEGKIQFFKRFLDDILALWCGSTKELHSIFEAMNKIHPNIKFTMNHTTADWESQEEKCDCDIKTSIPFLDTSLSIENGEIVVDLYETV